MSLGINSSSIGYSGSSLRFGLIDLRPVEIKETIKKAGIKFQRVIRRFENTQIPSTFSDMVYNQNEAIFSSIRIPDWFEEDKLVKEFSQRSIKSYEQDTEFKEAVKRIKESKGKIGRPLVSFVEFVREKFDSELDTYLEVESDRYVRSNLPLSFYTQLSSFDKTYQKFLYILEDNVRLFEFRARCARNFLMYGKHLEEMKGVIAPIIDQIDLCFFQYFRLKNYVALWNCKDYKELSNPRYLDLEKLDYSEFERLSNEYYTCLIQTKDMLLKQNKHEFNQIKDSFDDSTRYLFNNLITLPTGSLNLGS